MSSPATSTAISNLIDDLLARPTGLARYFTYIVTKPVKHSAGLPFALLMGSDPETR
jgi:Lrp/AsnC family transcriptional regulator of ectoine degradation